MDKIESLSNTLSNITLYDIKSMYNQAKNVVLNVSEMEAKVREATNEDPWGASSTLMQEIAQGTFHFQYFNEIMPCIYSRFMEKEARQWRQIYKALQLLEYLIKHGSERVVDDARSHVSTLKMLRNFHYIDEKGKDEGINVRNRSRELVELLADVEKIRSERRKAKANRTKYVGVGNDGTGFGNAGFDSGGGRYGGFSGDSLPSSYNNRYANGGSSSRTGGGGSFSDNRRQFEEYDAGDDDLGHTPARSNSIRNPTRKSSAPPPPPVAAPQPEVDLLGGLDDSPINASAPVGGLAKNKALPNVDDDDFDDFQAAPVQALPAAQSRKPTLMDMIGSSPAPAASVNTGFTVPQQKPPIAYGMNTQGMSTGLSGHRPQLSLSSASQLTPIAAQPQPPLNLFGASAAPLRPTPMGMASTISAPNGPANSSTDKRPTAPAVKSSSNFDDLWSMSIGSTTSATPAGAGKSIKDLEKEKATAGLWGAGQKTIGSSNTPRPAALGTFNTAPPSGADDLLL